MSYLVLARKYRPSVFASVSGQDHVTRTIANALKRDKVVHAYLFTGPRGVGKTSVSRILAKAINCQNPNNAEPCLECATCKEIGAGTSLAVREIDGASHNSVENVRDLMDSFKALPPPGYKRKIYIIDEVHMLSIAAFNALLKSLEEPPPHTVFILATTDVHKIPDTVISRCQRHDFRALSIAAIENRLAEVCRAEKIDADAESLKMIARMADGSMRDAQTLLDRVQSFCAGTIGASETSQALGTVDQRVLLEMAQGIFSRDVSAVLGCISEIFTTGIDPSTLLKDFVHFWREVFVAKLGGEGAILGLGLSKDAAVELLRLVSPLDAIDVQDLWDLARDGADRALRSSHPRYGLESLVVRMATRQPVAEIGALISKITASSEQPQGGVRPSASNKIMSAASQSAKPLIQQAPLASPQQTSASPSSSQPYSRSGGFVWEDFLSFAISKAGRVFAENLKRLRFVRCEGGIFEATGPDFTATSLLKEKEKVSELLNAYFENRGLERPRAWKILIQKGSGASEDAQTGDGAGRNSEQRSVQDHPAIQSLQKIFPGSKVEQVKSKA